MLRVGLISDTHGWLDPAIFNYFKEVDEIWHAGDFGTLELSDQLAAFKPLRGVYGNIDGKELRAVHPKELFLEIEGIKIYMTHIAGYPGNYNLQTRKTLSTNQFDMLICGHSHIVKVMRDKENHNMLTVNPGAAGLHGFHKIKTIMRFSLHNSTISNMEVIELGRRGKIHQ